MAMELRRRRQAGFSVAEVLIASLIFMAILVGVLPLFIQSMRSNVSAGDATSGSNFARSQLEEFLQLPFNSPVLTPNEDAPREEYFSNRDKVWVLGEPPDDGSDPALWQRTTTVRQYHISALDDGDLDPEGEALDAAADPAWVHLKQIQVEIRGRRSSVTGGGAPSFSFEVLKSQ